MKNEAVRMPKKETFHLLRMNKIASTEMNRISVRHKVPSPMANPVAAKEKIPEFSLLFIVIGGAFYMFGIIFYLWEKLPYNHAIWHVFVIGGCASHFIAVLHLVL